MKSFQEEIPSSRVNIKLDLNTGNAEKKVELPLKLLVVGDFSNSNNSKDYEEREKLNINKNNFDQVLANINPKITCSVPNAISENSSEELNVNLSIKSMKDFRPESVVENVPELRTIIAMRNLLTDLKSNIIDNKTFRKNLEKILLDKDLSARLKDVIPKFENM